MSNFRSYTNDRLAWSSLHQNRIALWWKPFSQLKQDEICDPRRDRRLLPVHFAVRSGAEVGERAGERGHPAPFLRRGTHGSRLLSERSTKFTRRVFPPPLGSNCHESSTGSQNPTSLKPRIPSPATKIHRNPTKPSTTVAGFLQRRHARPRSGLFLGPIRRRPPCSSFFLYLYPWCVVCDDFAPKSECERLRE